MACPLCDSEGSTIRKRPEGIDGKAVNCVLCTAFEILDNALLTLKSKPGDKELLPYLICQIRQASEQGNVFNVASHTWRDFALAHKNTPFSQRTEKLLDLLATRSNFQLGSRVEVNPKFDWPLVDARSENEFEYLLGHLSTSNYVDRIKFKPPVFELTPKAWERFEKAGIGHGLPGKCFVAMSFDDSVKEAYDSGIFLAVKSDENGACKIGLCPTQWNPPDKIVAEIRTCQFVVADVTLASQNVYFEVTACVTFS